MESNQLISQLLDEYLRPCTYRKKGTMKKRRKRMKEKGKH